MWNFLKKSKGFLGINERNIKYISPFNSKRAINIADSKILTKKILKKAGLPIAETYYILHNRKELKNFSWRNLPKSFVLKPNRGLGGEGIIVLYGKRKNQECWIKADKTPLTVNDLNNHILAILDGDFSIINIPDAAIFEERIKIHPIFKPYSHKGIPDIRIIVFNNIPVMAQLRLPTPESGGTANLHRGGIGVGIDMANGITTHAVHRDRLINTIPGSKLSFRGIKIPNWRELLQLAVEVQKATGLGFVGVDIAIDREKGPLILETNARPGLSIQIANIAPLGERLKRVIGLKTKNTPHAVRISRELFGGEIEEEIEEISGKKVIGIREKIKIFGPNEKQYETIAKIDTGAYRTSLCYSVAEKLNLNKIIKKKSVRSALGNEERDIVNLKFSLDNLLIDTEAFLARRENMKHDMIIGRKDIKKYLVDAAKNVRLK